MDYRKRPRRQTGCPQTNQAGRVGEADQGQLAEHLRRVPGQSCYGAVWGDLHRTRPWRDDNRRLALGALAGYLALNVLALGLNLLGVDGFWFLWLTPAALVGYLLLGQSLDRERDAIRHLAASSPGLMPSHPSQS